MYQKKSPEIINKESLDLDNMDFNRMKKQISLIKAMAQLSSSGITIYDLHKKIHIYTSSNFYNLFDYDIPENQTEVENNIFDRRVHPEDLKALAENGFSAMECHFRLKSVCFTK